MQADILFIQEHWLHSRDKNRITEDLPYFTSYTKCFDDDNIDDPLLRRRGHADVSIMFKSSVGQYVKELPDRGNRIVCISVNIDKPILIIFAYMPTHGKGYSRDNYQAILDEISEIKTKYIDTHYVT